MIVLCGINSAIQLYVFPAPVNNITDCFHLYGYDVRFACLPIRPTDCERGEGETVSEGENSIFLEIDVSIATRLTPLPF